MAKPSLLCRCGPRKPGIHWNSTSLKTVSNSFTEAKCFFPIISDGNDILLDKEYLLSLGSKCKTSDLSFSGDRKRRRYLQSFQQQRREEKESIVHFSKRSRFVSSRGAHSRQAYNRASYISFECEWMQLLQHHSKQHLLHDLDRFRITFYSISNRIFIESMRSEWSTNVRCLFKVTSRPKF
jgi:hypothetical protein